MAARQLLIGIDVGGTFTDLCIMDDATGELRVEKTASSADPIDGIMAGVTPAGIELGQVEVVLGGVGRAAVIDEEGDPGGGLAGGGEQ